MILRGFRSLTEYVTVIRTLEREYLAIAKGRTPNRYISEQDTLSVQQFVQCCPTKDWRVYNVRETTRGSLKLRVLPKSVYVWDKQRVEQLSGPLNSMRANLFLSSCLFAAGNISRNYCSKLGSWQLSVD
jgi:hypothetical protein